MILDLGFRMVRSWISDDQRSQEKRWCFTSMSWTPLRTYNNFLVMIMLVVVILMMIMLVLTSISSRVSGSSQSDESWKEN